MADASLPLKFEFKREDGWVGGRIGVLWELHIENYVYLFAIRMDKYT